MSWDFKTHLALYAALKSALVDRGLVKRVVDYFMDVVVDTHCVKERDSKLPAVYRPMGEEGVSEVIRALYQRIWGVDIDTEPEPVSRRIQLLLYRPLNLC